MKVWKWLIIIIVCLSLLFVCISRLVLVFVSQTLASFSTKVGSHILARPGHTLVC